MNKVCIPVESIAPVLWFETSSKPPLISEVFKFLRTLSVLYRCWSPVILIMQNKGSRERCGNRLKPELGTWCSLVPYKMMSSHRNTIKTPGPRVKPSGERLPYMGKRGRLPALQRNMTPNCKNHCMSMASMDRSESENNNSWMIYFFHNTWEMFKVHLLI